MECLINLGSLGAWLFLIALFFGDEISAWIKSKTKEELKTNDI